MAFCQEEVGSICCGEALIQRLECRRRCREQVLDRNRIDAWDFTEHTRAFQHTEAPKACDIPHR